MTLTLMAFQMMTFRVASASVSGEVVINEIAWAGSNDSPSDEWIELYNSTNQNVDLTGWYIEDDGNTIYEIEDGEVCAHCYFVIEKSDDAVSNRIADALVGLSLANTGDSLILYDANGELIDAVNSLGGPWFAGNTDKASMERADPSQSGDDPANWMSAISGNGSISREGSEILGTPGSVNSNYAGAGASVSFAPDDVVVDVGDSIVFSVKIDEADDLYAYGFDINYDPSVFSFVSANEGDFLIWNGFNTAFNAGLENGEEGNLIVANARLLSPALGIDGSGELFELTFEVIGENQNKNQITFGGKSYLADSIGDVPGKFKAANVLIGHQPVNNAEDLEVSHGENRYSLKLNWAPPVDGADSYLVKKQLPDGTFVTIGETTYPFFEDGESLVPGIDYNYQIVAVKSGSHSAAAEITGREERGIPGDNDRSDRIDGKDIENLARSYGSKFGEEEYNSLTDSNYDGIIDGSDLIDIGANFGLTF